MLRSPAGLLTKIIVSSPELGNLENSLPSFEGGGTIGCDVLYIFLHCDESASGG